MFRSQRPKENLDRVWVRRWQVRAEGIGDVPAAREELLRVEAVAGILRECTDGEAGVHARDVVGQAPHECVGEECLEGLSHVTDIVIQVVIKKSEEGDTCASMW